MILTRTEAVVARWPDPCPEPGAAHTTARDLGSRTTSPRCRGGSSSRTTRRRRQVSGRCRSTPAPWQRCTSGSRRNAPSAPTAIPRGPRRTSSSLGGRASLVFARRTGVRHRRKRISANFTRQADLAGLPRISFRDLRHAYATIALRAGVCPEAVSKRLDHSSVVITLSLYAHVFEHDDRGSADGVTGQHPGPLTGACGPRFCARPASFGSRAGPRGATKALVASSGEGLILSMSRPCPPPRALWARGDLNPHVR